MWQQNISFVQSFVQPEKHLLLFSESQHGPFNIELEAIDLLIIQLGPYAQVGIPTHK